MKVMSKVFKSALLVQHDLLRKYQGRLSGRKVIFKLSQEEWVGVSQEGKRQTGRAFEDKGTQQTTPRPQITLQSLAHEPSHPWILNSASISFCSMMTDGRFQSWNGCLGNIFKSIHISFYQHGACILLLFTSTAEGCLLETSTHLFLRDFPGGGACPVQARAAQIPGVGTLGHTLHPVNASVTGRIAQTVSPTWEISRRYLKFYPRIFQ